MPAEDALFLVDGSYNVHRAFHARGVPDMRAPDGTPTKATYIFTRMLLAILDSENPRYLGVAFDLEGPTLRHEEYAQYVEEHPEAAAEMAGYKATRPETPADLSAQFPWCRKVCEGLRIPLLDSPGYEADDIIGTLARKAAGQGLKVVLVTADKDLFQLVGDGIVILNPHKDNLVMDEQVVESVFGVRPRQVADVLALMGDASDNIPGVPGIGEKGAKDLIRQFGDLETLLDKAGEVKRKGYREALQGHAGRARLSRNLATIRTDAPVPFDLDALRVSEPDGARLHDIFRSLDFRSLVERWKPADAPEAAPAVGETEAHRALVDPARIRAFADEAARAGRVAVGVAASSENPIDADPIGISLCIRPGEAVYIPLGHSYLGAPEQPSPEAARELLAPVLSDGSVAKIGHDLKRAASLLDRAGIELAGVAFDTMIAAYLLDPARRVYGLDAIAREHLGGEESQSEPGAGTDGLAGVEIDRAAGLVGREVERAWRLAETLRGRLEAEGLAELFDGIEMPLVPVLSEMERTGVRIDAGYLGELSVEMAAEMDRISREVFDLAGHPFNLDSPVQLRQVLFEELGLKPVGRTAKTKAYSTRDEDLEVLAKSHDLPARVRDYRTVSKLRSTYVEALPKLVNARTGRVHTSFNQTGAASGRLSSSDPNLQNVPIRTELGRRVRRAFLPEKGWRLLCADYSQVELRILAHITDDPALIEAFSSEEDVHRSTAARIFDRPYDEVTADERRVAKTINFGVLYGMGDFRLSRELGIPRKDARKFIDAYFERFGAVRRYIDETTAQVERTGEVRTLLGRIRRFPEIRSGGANARQQALRAAVNTTIQGTAADLMKKGMVTLSARLKKEGLASRMLIQVHDEIVLEGPPGEMRALRAAVEEELESVHPLRVPLVTEIREGKNWLEAK